MSSKFNKWLKRGILTTSIPHLPEDFNIEPYLVNKVFKDSLVLNKKNFDYHKNNSFQIKSNGKVESKLHFFNAIIDYRGLVGHLLNMD